MQGLWDYLTGLAIALICLTILELTLQVGGC